MNCQKSVRLAVILLGLAVSLNPGTARASAPALYNYENYVVQKGDTLWDIAIARLENPFLWPKVWQVNPEIENPDLIFPGQVIRIPADLLKPELRPIAKPAPAPEPPPATVVETPPPVVEPPPPEPSGKTVPVKEARFLASAELIAQAGYIAKKTEKAGIILGSETEHRLFGLDDHVYVDLPGAAVGQRFSVFREIKEVVHPVTREPLGTLIEILGALEITAVESGGTTAVITASFTDISQGAFLGSYYDEEAPLVSAVPRTPDIGGYVVEIRERRKMVGGEYDILYIDKGANDGILPGDIFTLRRHPPSDSPYAGLYKEIATIQVLRTEPETATAMVLHSILEGRPGDRFGPVDR